MTRVLQETAVFVLLDDTFEEFNMAPQIDLHSGKRCIRFYLDTDPLRVTDDEIWRNYWGCVI